MTNRLSRIRFNKMQAQSGLCYYCRQPMWTGDPAQFCERHGLTRRRARWHICTAEHLHARCDGGADSDDNIVAACWYCNWTRHKSPKPLAPESYAMKVRKRMESGSWYRLKAVDREPLAMRAQVS